MSWDKASIGQIQLPDPTDTDPHPRLLLDGRGIHAGESLTALFPDGWRDITLEMRWEPTGPGCWYISTPGYGDVCPVGLFVKLTREESWKALWAGANSFTNDIFKHGRDQKVKDWDEKI